jgi:hypothetical protein
MPVVRPLLPSNVQLFRKKASLCQLQSHSGRELSIVTPAIGHDFLILRQLRHELIEIGRRNAPRTRDVPIGERLTAASIDQDKIEVTAFHCVKHVIPLLFRPKLVDEVVSVRANIILFETHLGLSFTSESIDHPHGPDADVKHSARRSI